VEVERKEMDKQRISSLEDKVRGLEHDLAYERRKKELDIELAKAELRKEMSKSLIESDVKRADAIARLETYEKMDTKDERKAMMSMLEKTIAGLAQQAKIQIVK
jgi:hypothetical protein